MIETKKKSKYSIKFPTNAGLICTLCFSLKWRQQLISHNFTDITGHTLHLSFNYSFSLKLSIVGDSLLSMPRSIACPPPLRCPLTSLSHIQYRHTHVRSSNCAHTHSGLSSHAQQSYMAHAHRTTHAPLMLYAHDSSWASSLPGAAEASPQSRPSLFATGRSPNSGHRATATTTHNHAPSCGDKCSGIPTSNW